jgi:hypothetical protein
MPSASFPTLQRLRHVEVEARDGIGKFASSFLVLRAALGDHVLEDGKQES